MISQNVYVKFDTFNTRDEVLDFVYDEKELNSNINNWKEDLDKYISYKDKHLKKYREESNYRNIYAYHLTVLIPIDLQNQKEEFVKNYMENIDKRFIRMYLNLFKKEKESLLKLWQLLDMFIKNQRKLLKSIKGIFIMTVKPKNSVLKQIRMLY